MEGKILELKNKREDLKIYEVPVCPDCHQKMAKGYYTEVDDYGRLLKVYAWFCNCS